MPTESALPEFKLCSACKQDWPTRDLFLTDPAIKLVGYQVSFETLTEGFFLFNHSCESTLAISAEAFINLYKGEMFSERAPAGECLGKCLHQDDLSPCPLRCECAFVREILQIIKGIQKEH
jgi:hypothetical protein